MRQTRANYTKLMAEIRKLQKDKRYPDYLHDSTAPLLLHPSRSAGDRREVGLVLHLGQRSPQPMLT